MICYWNINEQVAILSLVTTQSSTITFRISIKKLNEVIAQALQITPTKIKSYKGSKVS